MSSDGSTDRVLDRDEWMRRTGPLYPALVAVRVLTRLPVLRGAEINDEDTGRAAPWFPVVGSLVGGVLAALALAVLHLDLVPAIVAALVVAAAAVVTGAAHEAELARTTEILGRSNDDDLVGGIAVKIGLYGMLALVVVFAIRWILLLGIDPEEWIGALIVSQIAVRWSLLLLLKIGDRLDEVRSGRSLMIGQFSWLAFGVASGVAGVVGLFFGGVVGLLALLLAALIAFLVGLFFQRRYGGLGSISLGAASVICELTVLVCFAAGHAAVTSPWAL